MKLIFLDVDGVLNTSHSRVLDSISKGCLRRFERVVKETNSRVVLSSSWRKYEKPMNKLRRTLGYRFIGIFDQTPIIHNASRGVEVQQILDKYGSEVSKYAILDDNADFLDHQLPNFFQTNPDYGLTETDAYRVIKHLGFDNNETVPGWLIAKPERADLGVDFEKIGV